MMSYIGIHPDEYPIVRMGEDDSDYRKGYDAIYNERQQQEMVMWDGEWRDPSLLWDTLLVSTLQATAARAIPLEKRSQLPERAFRALQGEFDMFRALIYVKFKLKTECDKATNVAGDILNDIFTFDSEPYTSLSRAEKLTADLFYLRMKHIERESNYSDYEYESESDSDPEYNNISICIFP